MNIKETVLALIAVVALTAARADATIWDELTDGGGDAGDTIGTAQPTAAVSAENPLWITGEISGIGGDPEDIFQFTLAQAGSVTITTWPHYKLGGFDPDLYLFDAAGAGIRGNDDIDTFGGFDLDSLIGSRIGTIPQPVAPESPLILPAGVYNIAIGQFNSVAIDGVAGVWDNPFPGQFGPPGGWGPLATFDGSPNGNGGDYQIHISVNSAAPEPSTFVLATLCLLSLGMTRRRRRR